MSKKDLEELNKIYFGNTMEQCKNELGKYATRVWKAISYIDECKEKHCTQEKQYYAIEKLNILEEILTGVEK